MADAELILRVNVDHLDEVKRRIDAIKADRDRYRAAIEEEARIQDEIAFDTMSDDMERAARETAARLREALK